MELVENLREWVLGKEEVLRLPESLGYKTDPGELQSHYELELCDAFAQVWLW